MTPRKRKAGREDWPDNLYSNGRYYRYVHPQTRAITSLNCSLEQARQAAIIANAAIEEERKRQESELSKLLTRMVNPKASANYSFSQVLKFYKQERLVKLANKKTKKTLTSLFNIISRAPFAERKIREIEVLELDTWLQAQAPSNYRRVRSELIEIWKLAIRKGWQHYNAGNPADHTEVKPDPKRKRRRLTLDYYRAILDKASPRLKLAMQIMLHTTLRPVDVVNLKKSDFLPKEKLLRTIISKSKRNEDVTTAKYLEIELSQAEVTIIQNGMNTGIASPLIVHKPTRAKKKIAEDATHWSQCTVDLLSREFSGIRDHLGLCDTIDDKRQRPSLYEIRSLASSLHAQAKGKDSTQELMAHTDGDMTDQYLEGHQPKYTRVTACLNI